MDENIKDVAVLVAKRTLRTAKDDFTQFALCSPVFIALAFLGIIQAAWLGIAILTVGYFGYHAYHNYQTLLDEIEFDVHAAEYERKQNEQEKTKDLESNDKQ